MRAAMIVCVLLCAASTAVADASQLIFDVPEEGGIYEIPVHPQRLTVLYFAAPVTSFVHGDAHGATFNQRQHIITVEIAPASPTITMSVDCSLFRVGLLFRPVDDPEDAAVQVQFRDLSRREHIQAEVARQMELRRAEIDLARAKLDSEREQLQREREHFDRVVLKRARLLVGESMDKRLDIQHIRATQRNHAHVVLRIREIVWLGEDAYVRLVVENRGRTPYRIQDVSLTSDKLGSPLALPHTGKTRGQIQADSMAVVTVIIPNAATLARELVQLTFNPGLGATQLRVFLQP